MQLTLETIMSNAAIFIQSSSVQYSIRGNIGISNVQGSYAVFPTAFPDPSDPLGHTRLNAHRYCLLQSN